MGVAIDDQRWLELTGLWHQWTEVVDRFAQSEIARLRFDPVSYGELHGKLLSRCSALLATGDAAARNRLEEMVELAAPWVSTTSLEAADRSIVHRLAASCRTIDEEIGGVSWRTALRRNRFLVILASGTLLIVVFLGAAGEWSRRLLVRVFAISREFVWSVFKQISPSELWLAAGLVSLVGVSYILVRMNRS